MFYPYITDSINSDSNTSSSSTSSNIMKPTTYSNVNVGITSPTTAITSHTLADLYGVNSSKAQTNEEVGKWVVLTGEWKEDVVCIYVEACLECISWVPGCDDDNWIDE